MKNEITLTNVKIDKLRHAFGRSLMLKNSDALNFTISSSTVTGIASDKRDSFFKKWELITSDVCEFTDAFEEIKISIIKGVDFSKKMLGYFAASEDVTIKIEHVNGDGNKLTISNEYLEITLVLSPIALSYTEYDEKTLKTLFSPEEKLAAFVLTVDELKQIRSLSGLSTNPETQTTYVSLYTENNHLYATDNAFKLQLHDLNPEIETEFDIVHLGKNMLGSFCTENYVMEIYDSVSENNQPNCIIANSQDSNTIATVVLVTELDTAANEDFDFSNTDFNWDADEANEPVY